MTSTRTLLIVLVWMGSLGPPLAAAQEFRISGVKQVGLGPRCESTDEPVFAVARGRMDPEMEIRIRLKPPPAGAQFVNLSIELRDANSAVVTLLDAAEDTAKTDPPWKVTQETEDLFYKVVLADRLPTKNRKGTPRYFLRVSLDVSASDGTVDASSVVAKENHADTKPFLLSWQGRKEDLCKSIQ